MKIDQSNKIPKAKMTSTQNNASIKCNTMRPQLPTFHRYEFPVLADSPLSVLQARTDPLACNVNNDAVLIWNDVFIYPDHDPHLETSIPGATSIEDVFQELQNTVNAYSNASAKIVKDEHDGIDSKTQNHHHHHRRSRHQLNCENSVVFRRRLYEQGLDVPLVSSMKDLQNPIVNNTMLTCHVTDCPTDPNSNHISSNEGEDCLKCNCNTSLDEEKTVLRVPEKENRNSICGLSSDVCHYNENHQQIEMCQEGYNVSNQIDSIVFTANTNGDSFDNNIRSHLDSGHFEDMSTDFSPLCCTTGWNHLLYIDHNNKSFDTDFKRQEDSGVEKDKQENYVENLGKNENCDFCDDSEVFIQDSEENIDIQPEYCKRRLSKNRAHHHTQKSPRTRKQNLGKSGEWRNDSSIMIQCANQSCEKLSNLVNARKSYKNCHHCLRTYYCSRECRRQDWTRHKEHDKCQGSRVNSACKKVIRYCNSNPEIKAVLSRLAVRGYLAHGRGCVLLGFPDLENTEEFMEYGFPMLELNPIYVSAKELSDSKMYGNVLDNLLETCKCYKPDIKFVLNIGVGLRFKKEDFQSFSWQHHNHQYCYRNHNYEEMDRFGSQGSDLGYGSLSSNLNVSLKSVNPLRDGCSHCFIFDNYSQHSPSSRHKAPILQKFIKLRLTPTSHVHQEHEIRWTFESHFWDEYRTAGPTLILTGIPECRDGGQSEIKKRELTFINIQRKLRQRNVNLRHQYPSVFSHLIAYVTQGIHFPSQVLFPVDTKTGRTFTCFMMPEAEAELEWMQSHHLLHDLELSKDSLNKSLSKSLSSSMPSLLSPSQRSVHFDSKALPSHSKVDGYKKDSKQRSVILTHLSSSDNFETVNDSLPLQFIDYALESSVGDESHNPSSYGSKLKKDSVKEEFGQKNSNQDEHTQTETSLSKYFGKHGILSPIKIRVDHPPFPDNTDTNQCKGWGDGQWETNEKVIPSFYPVRKARNVKLNSHSHPSNAEIVTKHPDTSSQELIESTPSLAPPIESTAPPSPALYTSTPLTKTANPPMFEDFIHPTSPCLKQDSLSCRQSVSELPFSGNVASGDTQYYSGSAKHCKNYLANSEIRDKCIVREYGFDSSYRNKVVVDEVDQMKRRRKGRKGKKPKSLFNHDTEYYWFENHVLESPPLATSTLERSRCPERNPYSKPTRKNAKQPHWYCNSGNNMGHACKNVKNSSGASNSKEDSNKIEMGINESGVIHNDFILGSTQTNQFALVDGDKQFSASFRRKFNTNSPLFPKDFIIALPTSTLNDNINNNNNNNNNKQNVDNVESHTTNNIKNEMSKDLLTACSTIAPSTQSTYHSTPNMPNFNTTISTKLSSPIISDNNTRKAVSPKKSSGKRANSMMSLNFYDGHLNHPHHYMHTFQNSSQQHPNHVHYKYVNNSQSNHKIEFNPSVLNAEIRKAEKDYLYPLSNTHIRCKKNSCAELSQIDNVVSSLKFSSCRNSNLSLLNTQQFPPANIFYSSDW